MYNRISLKEFACLMLVLSMLLLVLLPACNSMPDDQKLLCQQNLKSIGAALKMYADEHEGMYPPLDARQCESKFINTSSMMFDVALLYPKYMKDFSLFVCPDDAELNVDSWINPDTQKMDSCLVKSTSYAYMAWSADEATFNKLGGAISAPYTEALKKLFQSDDIQQWEQDLIYADNKNEAIHFPEPTPDFGKILPVMPPKYPSYLILLRNPRALLCLTTFPGDRTSYMPMATRRLLISSLGKVEHSLLILPWPNFFSNCV